MGCANIISMRYAGIDYGTKRVGLSFSDEKGRMAFPECVFLNEQNLVLEIKKKFSDKKVEAVVIGESKDLDGKENPVMAEIKVFAERLKKETGLPIYFEPEYFTSTEAGRVLGKNKMHDASAAALILQNHLERQNNS